MRSPYRPRWPLLLALIGGVGILIALAYLPAEPSGEALPAQGGRYVEGVAGAPSRVNPLFATFNEVDQDLASLIFSGLVRLGPKGDIQPDLAEKKPTVTPDGLTYVFQLRRGLFWHDGERLDAADVLFTIQAIQDPDFEGDPVLADAFRDVQVDTPDDYTVVMTLPEAFAPFLARGATVGILPEHLLGGLDAAALFETPFNQRPVGSGPFRLADLTPTAAVLEPFDANHLGRPFIEGLELRFYRDDAEILNALLSEEVDGALFRPGLDPEEIASIDADERWVRRSLHTTMYSLVYLNPQASAFEDRLVRGALQHGLDRETLINEVLAGQALPLDSPIVRDLWASVGSPEAYAFDPTRAGLLLDATGWVLGEGGRAKDGAPLRFTLAASDDPVQVEVAQEIARQWGELGIQVEVEVSGASRFVEGVLLPRQFEAALVSIDPGPDPDPYPLWHSTQALGEGRNLASFSDPNVDRLLENGRLTPSAERRAEDYRSFQEIFAQELPAVLLYTSTYQYVVRSDLQGLSPGLLLNLSARFNDAHLWYVERGTEGDEGE
jgi:peptide/nickel transport system substrate-binding protein